MNLNQLMAASVIALSFTSAMGSNPLFTDVNYTDVNLQGSNGITFGDLDGDGILDMAGSDADIGVLIRMGNGDGTFGDPTTYEMNPGTPDVEFITESVELADLNGDGDLDIVTAGYGFLEEECDPKKDPDCEFGPINYADSGVHIRLNNGDGTFGALTSLAGLLDTASITIADIDGDTDLDVVATEFTNSIGMITWINNGSGVFGSPQFVNVGLFSADVGSGDFDGDGDTDIAIIRVGDNVLNILLNNGNGTFASPTTYAVTGVNPVNLDIGDVDDDGDLDIAVTTNISDQFNVFYNNGSGVFGTSQVVSTGNSPGGVRFADIDDDGDMDLLTSSSDDRYMNYHLNDGAGVFGARQFFNTGGVEQIAVADLNDDGLVDLGMSNIRYGSGYTVRLNTPDGFDGARKDYFPVANARSLAFVDFNGDSHIDIATAGQSAGVSVMINDGNGNFPTEVDAIAGSVSRAAAGDINGDTFPDLVLANFSSDDMTVLLNNTVGGFDPPVSYPVGDGPMVPILEDFDNDGDLDFATNAMTNANGNAIVLFNNGSGVFSAPTSYPVNGSPFRISSGDVNGDTIPDLVLSKLTGSAVSVLINDGTGIFATPLDYTTASRPITVALGDLDGDGDLDIVSGNDFFPDSATLLFNNGSGVFGSRVDFPGSVDPEDIELSDIDADGDLDLLIVNAGAAGYTIYLNDGSGVFTPDKDYLVGRIPRAIAASDVNEDGVMDIVAAQIDGFVSVHLGATTDTNDCPADFTGDGILDIFDVFDFIDAFNNLNPSADFTGDGIHDIFDVFDFIDAFNTGCP